MIDDLLEQYFEEIAAVAGRGDAREESYYPALKSFLEAFAEATDRADAAVTVLPSRTEAGNPDVRVWDGRQHITGYLEAKKPGADLDAIEESEQLLRYRNTFPNLILTDFCEFRLYRDGDLILEAKAGRPFELARRGAVPALQEGEETKDLLAVFFDFSLPVSYDAESLALALAKRTRFLRDVVQELLEEELEGEGGSLAGFYEAFQEYLISGLEPGDFADLYAQTLTYGLFAARLRAGEDFSRATAANHIPRSIGILHEIFEFISYGDVPEPLEWMVDDIAEVLAVAEAGAILDRYYREGKGTDPVIHFYETFLAEYDPDKRERLGVFYTPEPVVSYIVRSLHFLLKERFERSDGVASDGVTLLDPAAGTMTFVARASREAVDEFNKKYGAGAEESFLKDHVLQNFYAFELMMAPYAIGHLKMSYLMEEMGHTLNEDERFQLYLTNTLEMEELDQTRLPGLRTLAEESHLASEIKKETPILVILGNPPYSYNSFNPSWKMVPKRNADGTIIRREDGSIVRERKPTFIGELIQDYKHVGETALNERNPKGLQDDYVKFLRFAEWKLAQEGVGVVGMITNHQWLENPTFRGMRYHLLKTYDEIRILDLHGNFRKRETTPEGGKDENVFDIRPGVAITFFIRNHGTDDMARVWHANLWGLREDKYAWLEKHDFSDTEWQELHPTSDFYVFSPRSHVGREQYESYPQVTDIFMEHGPGVKTHRDHFVIAFEQDELVNRIRALRNKGLSDNAIRQRFKLTDTQDWNLAEKRSKIQEDHDWRDAIIKIMYRPFDERWIFYHYDAIDRGREETMRHLLAGSNLALSIGRAGQVVGTESWNLVFCSDQIIDTNLFYRGGNQVLPLYIYPEAPKEQIAYFEDFSDAGPRANLSPHILDTVKGVHGPDTTPEDIFCYIYSILHAPSYREKYADFLKIDFPRIPWTANTEIFSDLSRLGHHLVALHRLDSPELDSPVVQFHGSNGNEVESRKTAGFLYDDDRQRKYINEKQYFGPIPPSLWEFRVGGYHVLDKWLRDRKGRKLTITEIRTYCRIVTALHETVQIQEEIDALYPEVESDLIEMDLAE